MKVAVTGATGHVGANLVPALVQRGDDVRVLVHDNDAPLEGLDVERLRGDVRDAGSLRRVFEGVDVVFHLAAIISIDGDRHGLVRSVNVDGARNAARAALEAGVDRMVHFCSVHAFDQSPLDQPLDETRARVPDERGRPAYDRSKAAGERGVREVIAEGLDAVILHPTGIVGPGDHEPSRMGRVLLDLYHRSLPSLVHGGFDWVDVRDVVQSALSAADRGRTGESYLLSGRWGSVAEVAALACEATGVRPPRLTAPQWLARVGAPFTTAWGRITGREPLYTAESLAALRANRHIVCDKAAAELGHTPRPLRASIRDAYAWFAELGKLPAGAVIGS